MFTLQESPLYQEVCIMDMHCFVILVKARGQAQDFVFTLSKVQCSKTNTTNCFSPCYIPGLLCVCMLGLVCKVLLDAIKNQAFHSM